MRKLPLRLIDTRDPRSEESSGPTRPERLKAILGALVDLVVEEIDARGHAARSLDRPLLTPEEAAAITKVPKSTLLDLAKRGVIPSLRFGKAVRFDPADLA